LSADSEAAEAIVNVTITWEEQTVKLTVTSDSQARKFFFGPAIIWS